MPPSSHDPYKNFRFRVKWDGRHVAGLSQCSGLERTPPGRIEHGPIVLERGVTHDGEFERWANTVWNFPSHRERRPQDIPKDLRIEVFDEAGEMVAAYSVRRAWPSEFQALPDVTLDPHTTAIQRIELDNESWQRDGG
jgi:phage tail-like protein